MKKLGVIIDSFSGFNQKEINDFGFYFLPLQIVTEGESFLEGIKYSSDESNQIINNSKKPMTSQVPPLVLEEIIKKAADENDEVIVLSLSSGLSGTYNSCLVKAKEYKNVTVVDNSLCGYMFIEVAQKISKMYENDNSIEQIVDFIHKYDEQSMMFIIPKNLDALIRSGRLKGAKKIVLDKLNLIPIIKFKVNNSLVAVKRSLIKSVIKVMQKILKFVDDKTKDYEIKIIHANDQNVVDIAKKIIEEEFGMKIDNVSLAPASIVVHTGIGSIGISVNKKIDLI